MKTNKSKIRLINMMLIFLAVIALAGCKPDIPPYEITPGAYTDRDKADVLHMLDLVKNGKHMAFDFSDPAQYRFYKKMLYASGWNEKSSPQLFKVLEKKKDEHIKARSEGKEVMVEFVQSPSNSNTVSPVNVITSFNNNGGNLYTTSGLSSFPTSQQIYASAVSISMYDHLGNPVGIAASNSAYGPTQAANLEVNTLGNDTVTDDTLHTFFTYFYQDSSGTHHRYTNAYTTNVVDTIVNKDPMSKSGQTIIMVCMNRSQSDCSYSNQGTTHNLMFPMKGKIIYSGNVNVDDSSGKPNDGAFYSISLTRLPSGGGCSGIPMKGDFWDYVKVNKDTLSWSIEPAEFDNTCLSNGDSVLFQMTVYVKIGKDPAYATITNAPDAAPPYLRIPKMQIRSGCFALGTKVMMADGSMRKVEDIEENDELKSSVPGKNLQVYYVVTGNEKNMYRLMDDKNHEIWLSKGHPVVTIDGFKKVEQLRAGDQIKTIDGNAKVVSIDMQPYNDRVINLGLKVDPKMINEESAGLYANGILAGDAEAQNFHRHLIHETKEDILKMLPKEWHQDYLNYLERTGKKK